MTRGTDRYLLPLWLHFEDEIAGALPRSKLALARVRRGRRVGFLTDAFSHSTASHARVVELLGARRAGCRPAPVAASCSSTQSVAASYCRSGPTRRCGVRLSNSPTAR